MFNFFGLLVIIGLLIRFGKIIYRVTNKITSYQESPELSSALFVKMGTTGAEYLEMASNAMIYENKNLEEVKQLLRNKGMYEENIDFYTKKARERYDKWLNENGEQPKLTAMQQYELLHKQPAPVDSNIVLSSTPGEDHAHHFCALIGKQRYFTDSGREILYNATAAALNTDPVMQNDTASIRQKNFQKYGGAEFNPQLRVVVVKGQQEAVFPYLKTDMILPFQTKKIMEWENNDHFEAEIEGVCGNGLSLGFFATDYAVNKHIYKTRQEINVKLSAFVLEISGSERTKDDLENRQDVTGYWPSQYYGLNSYFEFEAVLLKVTVADIDILSKGGILSLKLIDNKQGRDLIVDAYTNITSITAAGVHKDLNVTGILWFQGEIAE